MKNNNSQSNLINKPCLTRFIYNLAVKSLIIVILIMAGVQSPLHAQEAKYTNPSWWFGVAGGANFNFYRGTTQHLSDDFMAPAAFHDGKGIGLFAAPLIEFHRPDTRLGFMLQAGYDSRRGKFDQMMAPCNCPEDLNTDLDYITLEPSLRFAPFRSNFYLYAGPRLAYNLNKNFTYQKSVNPDFPDPVVDAEINGEFSDINEFMVSMQVGAGYDIQLSPEHKQTKAILSPFVSYHPYFGQNPRSQESWNMNTLRAGLALKFGRGHEVVRTEEKIVAFVPVVPPVKFAVTSPKNLPGKSKIRETFPLLNYVFFDLGSTEIPNRYVLLKKDQVKDFKEEQLEELAPLTEKGRSNRQMITYYNALNILGDRMGKNPTSTITLVGTSELGSQDGKLMAESVKNYLVDVFGIGASRIKIEVRNKPKLPSEQPGGTLELALLRQEDRRVTIESSSRALLTEFNTGGDYYLKPAENTAAQEAPLDSYVTFNVAEGNDDFSSWMVEVKDEKGQVQSFGPYTEEEVSIPGKLILGNNTEGDYKVTLIGSTNSGMQMKRDTTVHMKQWAPPADEEGMRYSVIYEFNDSKAITIYEKYLAEVVTSKIPVGGTVKIHGYTDIIGDETNNQNLSLARANDVKKIMENSLSKAGRSDVKFEVNGYGENEQLSPFDNKFPEERFYNRTVIIDILPKK